MKIDNTNKTHPGEDDSVGEPLNTLQIYILIRTGAEHFLVHYRQEKREGA